MPYVFGSQVDLSKIPVKNIVIESASSAPSSPVNGQQWYDTSVHRHKAYENGAWILVSNTGTELTANKGAASGYASLDGSIKVPIAQLPTGTTASTVLLGNTRLDQLTAPTASVTMNSQRITNLLASSAATDAVNRAELDAAMQGIRGVKEPVRVASQANITISAPGSAIDGVTLTSQDRVLLAGQTTTADKGIYVFNGAASPMTRATDADATGEIVDGTTVAVAEGTYAGSIYIQTATPSGAPGAWSQVWTVFNTGGTTYTAGTGLTLSTNQFSISASYVGQTSITTLGTITTGTWTGTDIAVADGGTGSSTASGARTNLSSTANPLPQKYAATLGALTAGAETTITHNLNTTDVIVGFKSVGDTTVLMLNWRTIDANSIGVTADIAYSASAVRAVVIG